MATYNNMKSVSRFNGGAGKYTANGFQPSRSTGNSKGSGCGMFAVLAFAVLSAIPTVLYFI